MSNSSYFKSKCIHRCMTILVRTNFIMLNILDTVIVRNEKSFISLFYLYFSEVKDSKDKLPPLFVLWRKTWIFFFLFYLKMLYNIKISFFNSRTWFLVATHKPFFFEVRIFKQSHRKETELEELWCCIHRVRKVIHSKK